jgi:tubulin-specific chaperone A
MAKEMASSERAIMTGFVAEDKPVTQSEMSAWMQVSKGQDALLTAFKYQITEKILKEFQRNMRESNIKAVMDIRKQIRENLANGNFELRPKLVFAATTERIDDLKKVEDAQLQEILKEAIALSSEKMISVIIYSGVTGGSAMAMFILCFFIAKSITKPITMLSKAAKSVAEGQLDHNFEIKSRSEIGELADSFNDMISNLRLTTEKNDTHNWLKTGQMELNVRMRGEQDTETLGRNIIGCLTEYLNAQIGLLYMSDNDNSLKLIGSYAYAQRKNFMQGEDLVGQAALGKKHILLTNYPDDSININSGLVEATPKHILIYPLILDNTVRGVVELGSFHEFNNIHLIFLEQVAEGIAIALNTVISRKRTEVLLEQTQQQAEELQAREVALRQSNEELEENAIALKESESRLQAQQEELRQINEELEKQKKYVEKKNKDLKDARVVIEARAQDLEQSSKYKSEFLANMSHELRTPLNSILLLSRLLADNKDDSLSEDQVESVQSINSSGNDLLELINDVLDLSKVESGKTDLQIEDMYLQDFCNNIKRNFQHVAKEKRLNFNIEITDGLPKYILTDEQRVEQIVKNFLSNAFKFTSEGSISLRISHPNELSGNAIDLSKSKSDQTKTVLISVIDTGIGIPEEKQGVIFEAFKQADGTTSRKYGGTGLGLSISKELAKLLNGNIYMKSTCGKGSTFTLCLPETFKSETKTMKKPPVPSSVKTEPETYISEKNGKQVNRKEREENIKDDRKTITKEDKSVLIIEDDPGFLKILRNSTREHGFKCLVAGDGKTGLQFADYYKPSGIILDVNLPGINGWTVMARLKDNPETRHIPVHFISASDNKIDAIKMGAIDYVTKPVSPEVIDQVFERFNKIISKPVKDLLIVEDNPEQAKTISSIIGSGDVNVTIASTAMEAYNQILSGKFDCMVLGITLPDMSGIELLNKIRKNEELFQLPVIVYTGRELTKEEKKLTDEYAAATIMKGAGSHRKLLDETTLFLHRVEANLSEVQQKILRVIHDRESVMAGRMILIVDDDMRNVFSIKKILEGKDIKILVGRNGKEGLACLNNNPDIHLVLMDIMMPEMDGYTAIEEIRKQNRFKKLPIIALTAKAMKGDRAKCIEAGANDYLAKPFDIDRLFSMLRVWLY